MKPLPLLGRKLGLGLGAGVLLIAFGLVLARSGPLAPIQVTTLQVDSAALTPGIFGIGTVESRRSYLIGPTAAGRVKAVHVDVGDPVKAGQLLAEIDSVDLDERIRSADAAHARALSAIAAAEAQKRDAQARRQVAENNARRYVDLGAKYFVSRSAVEGKQQELDAARAAEDASDANLLGARQERVRLKADLDALRQQQRNLRLIAPRDGKVLSREAEAGSTVIAGQAVLRLFEPDNFWIRTRLDQSRARGLALGQAAEINLRSNPDTPLPGQVARMEPLSDSVTEERIVLVTFAQIPAGLSVGEMAEVTIRTGDARSGLALPNAAIRQTPQGAGVWRLKDGKPHFTPVNIGQASLDGQILINSGLTAGDEVIVHSEREISTEARIKVVEKIEGKTK